MGQNFVSLDFGKPGAERVTDGTFLETTEQADFAALMSKLDKVAGGAEVQVSLRGQVCVGGKEVDNSPGEVF
jgi:hypothetical protein